MAMPLDKSDQPASAMAADPTSTAASTPASPKETVRVAAASVIVIRGGEVLLVKRAKGGSIGVWSAPGGHIDDGETAEAAARRELLEETGLAVGGAVGALLPLAIHTVTLPARADAPERIYDIVVFAAAAEPEACPRAASDAADAMFIPLEQLPGIDTTAGLEDLAKRAAALILGT